MRHATMPNTPTGVKDDQAQGIARFTQNQMPRQARAVLDRLLLSESEAQASGAMDTLVRSLAATSRFYSKLTNSGAGDGRLSFDYQGTRGMK